MRRIFLSAVLLLTLAPVVTTLGACDKNLNWSFGGAAQASPGGGGGGGGAPSVASNGGGGGDKPFAATATSGPETWKRYDLRGAQLGMSRKQLLAMGFTCGEDPSSRCYKIMDDRCKTGTCKLKKDEWMSEQWFELNGARTNLDYITCATTPTDAALVWDCRLQISPRQLLTKDSALGKAMIGKYGMYIQKNDPQPEDKDGGGTMMWWNTEVTNGGPMINADCNDDQVDHQCRISITDYGLRKLEQENQTERDQQKRSANQPKTAPAL